MIHIGFGHRSGVGKDTCGKFLVSHLSATVPHIKVKQINFADKLKDICYQLYAWAGLKRGVHYDNCREDRNIVLAPIGMTPVEIWVKVGQQLREVDPNIWVRWLKHSAHNADIVVTCDVRHYNEVEIFDYKIKVTNPEVPRREGVSIDDVLMDYQGWDREILNSGTLKRLNGQMVQFAEQLIREHNLAKA